MFLDGVIHLDNGDFTSDLKLKPEVSQGKPSIVMLQKQACGYCTEAKPAYKSLNANANGFNVYTIQLEYEPELVSRIKGLDPNTTGVPAYWGFDKDGKFVRSHTGSRDANSLREFIGVL